MRTFLFKKAFNSFRSVFLIYLGIFIILFLNACAPSLNEMVFSCKLPILEKAVQQGANVNTLNDNLETPLMVASRLGQEEVINFLIKHGANIDFRINNGPSPLWCNLLGFVEDSLESRSAGLDVLLMNKANANLICQNMLPIEYAIYRSEKNSSYISAIEELVKYGAKLNILDSDKSTPLYYAIKLGTLSTVDLLLKNGADPNYCDSKLGITPLLFAANEDSDSSKVALLLKYGADVSKTCHSYFFCVVNKKDKIQAGLFAGEVSPTILNGFFPNYRQSQDSLPLSLTTPLHLAAWHGNTPNCIALASYKAAIDALDFQGITPLILATLSRQYDTVLYLLSQGANFSMKDKYGLSAYDYASLSKDPKLISIFTKISNTSKTINSNE